MKRIITIILSLFILVGFVFATPKKVSEVKLEDGYTYTLWEVSNGQECLTSTEPIQLFLAESLPYAVYSEKSDSIGKDNTELVEKYGYYITKVSESLVFIVYKDGNNYWTVLTR